MKNQCEHATEKGECLCAECGREIADGEDYLTVDDNFLQARYFDSAADNIFCSEGCLCRALSVRHVTKGGAA